MDGLVNVCLEPFVSRVQSSSVASDGCTAANLVSTERTARCKGFRVEHFIRPPVSVLLEFKWPMNVACVLVRPGLEVGSEMKVCLDGCHISGIDSYQYNLHQGVVSGGNQALLLLQNRSFDRKWDKKIDFTSEVVAMVQGSQAVASDVDSTSVTKQPLRHINIASRLKQLRLTVTHLTGVKPVAVSWVEVWGTLSDNCSNVELTEYRTAVRSIGLSAHSDQYEANLFAHHNPYHRPDQCSAGPLLKPPDLEGQEVLHDLDSPSTKRQRIEERIRDMGSLPSPSSVCYSSQPVAGMNMSTKNNPDSIILAQSDGNISSHCNSFLGVPTKFLDAITYEVMLLPMLLPSGHFVDRSTVEKLASSDALYGRSPTDPFTGVVFTECSKPQFCPERKLEIDQFLTRRDELKESEDLVHPVASSRTVGGAADIANHLARTTAISSCPNERTHPVLQSMASPDERLSPGGPSSSSGHRGGGCEDKSAQVRHRRKHGARTRGVNKDCSFEDKISGSLDAALDKLFSSNY